MPRSVSIILSDPVSSKYESGEHLPQPSVVVAPFTLSLPENTTTKSSSNILAASILSVPKASSLPEKYDIRDKLSGFLTHVLNQGKCGSCWSFSMATAASDIFTLNQIKKGKKLTSGVMISPMSFMYNTGSKSKNNGCNGGDPIRTTQYILENDRKLVTPSCNDYSWYVATQDENLESNNLNSKWIKYAPNISNNGEELSLSETDTVQLRCFENANKGEHYQFSLGQTVLVPGLAPLKDIDEIYLTFSDTQPDMIYNKTTKQVSTTLAKSAVNNQLFIKQHLTTHGSVVIGIPIFMGFMPGGGNLTNSKLNKMLNGNMNMSWIVDSGDNDLKDGSVYLQNPKDKILDGGHAVTIVGWGRSKTVETASLNNLNKWYGKGAMDIQKAINNAGGNLGNYWIVRNSWGTVWPSGIDNVKKQGYFCLAMYPSNLFVQVSHPFKMNSQNSSSQFYNNFKAYSGSLNLFSLYIGFSADGICGGESDKNSCINKLKTYPENTLNKLFNQLDNIKNKDKTTLLEKTHTTELQLDEWSNYLISKNFYKNPSDSYITNRPSNKNPSDNRHSDNSKKLSNLTIIFIILISIFSIIIPVVMFLK